MGKERKATEVLLELEAKIDNALKYMQTIDHNVKLLHNYIIGKTSKPKPEIEESQNVIKAIPSDNEEKKTQGQPTVESFVQVSGSNVKKPVKPNATDMSSKKIMVYQKVVYDDAKYVILAKVEVFDESKNLASQTKTDMTGSWRAELRPGKYSAHILKGGTSNRPVVDKRCEFVVEQSDKPIELEILRV